jgi:hypothetical protein
MRPKGVPSHRWLRRIDEIVDAGDGAARSSLKRPDQAAAIDRHIEFLVRGKHSYSAAKTR